MLQVVELPPEAYSCGLRLLYSQRQRLAKASASTTVANSLVWRNSSLKRVLNDSAKPFCPAIAACSNWWQGRCPEESPPWHQPDPLALVSIRSVISNSCTRAMTSSCPCSIPCKPGVGSDRQGILAVAMASQGR